MTTTRCATSTSWTTTTREEDDDSGDDEQEASANGGSNGDGGIMEVLRSQIGEHKRVIATSAAAAAATYAAKKLPDLIEHLEQDGGDKLRDKLGKASDAGGVKGFAAGAASRALSSGPRRPGRPAHAGRRRRGEGRGEGQGEGFRWDHGRRCEGRRQGRRRQVARRQRLGQRTAAADPTVDRHRRPGGDGLQPVDAVRGAELVHAPCRVGRAGGARDRRLAREHLGPAAALEGADHRADPERADRLGAQGRRPGHRRDHVPRARAEADPRRGRLRLAAAGLRREARLRPACPQARGQDRPLPLQGVRRDARRGDRALARQDRGRRGQGPGAQQAEHEGRSHSERCEAALRGGREEGRSRRRAATRKATATGTSNGDGEAEAAREERKRHREQRARKQKEAA